MSNNFERQILENSGNIEERQQFQVYNPVENIAGYTFFPSL